MTVRNLQYFMKPSSVALIGASERASTVGEVLTRNLIGANRDAEIYLVNPSYSCLAGAVCYPDVASLPKAPDLAVIATPRDSVPGVIEELARLGTKAVVVITSGFCEGGDAKGKELRNRMLEAAGPHLLRIVGPNCLGILVPRTGLNASMAHVVRPIPGNIAFVAQSGAVQTAVLDWAISRGIGFSHFISLGDMADVDFGDLLDILATDPYSRAILLYMETVTHARKFMSAARAAARVKPVIVFKAGRTREGALAAARHTGSVAGDDAVCDAAFRRAGMLRVYEMQALFDAVETLAMMPRPIPGNRLAILTNGGGVGVIAADALVERGGRVAELSPETVARLDEVLPPTWSRGNPVDIMSDAPAERYAEALEVILEDPAADGVLVLNCPIAVLSGTDAAAAVVRVYEERLGRPKPPALLTSWLGDQAAAEPRRLFAQHRIPSFKTPSDAVRAFMHMVHYRQNQEMLMQTPPSIPETFSPDLERALKVIGDALAEGHQWLTPLEAKSILTAYGIPVLPCLTATSPQEAAVLALELAGPVSLQVLSRDLDARDDLCPIAPRLETPDAVLRAAEGFLESLSASRPTVRVLGFSLRPALHDAHAHALRLRIREDEQFGPVIVIGPGGELGGDETTQDDAIALPPLNMHLARQAIAQSRIFQRLKGSRCMPPADLDALALTLVQVSQLICDLAEIAELEIDPLVASASGVVAVDASVRIARSPVSASERLAIRPYPKELEESLTLSDGKVLRLRPIRPEDEPGFLRIFESLSIEDRRMRFLHPVQELSHPQAARLTQIDYDREMALVLAETAPHAGGGPELYGSVRLIADPDSELAEYAIVVRRDVAGKGLGRMLMQRIIGYARSRGIKEIFGQVLCENAPMLKVCRTLGFASKRDPDDPGVIVVSLRL